MTHQQLDQIKQKVDERFENGRHDKCLLEGIFSVMMLMARSKVIDDQLILRKEEIKEKLLASKRVKPTKRKKLRRHKS